MSSLEAALDLAISPHGAFSLDPRPEGPATLPAPVAARITAAFERSTPAGLLHLASVELGSVLPPSLAFGRELGRLFFTELCRTPDLDAQRERLLLPAPTSDLGALAAAAPPMRGAEYLSEEALGAAWTALNAEVAGELAAFEGTAQEYLQAKSPAWNTVGRVCFHLAENKGNDARPFAFLATYAARLSREGRVQHAPIARAIEEQGGAGNKQELLRLLSPVHRAAEGSAFLRALVDSGEVWSALAWTPEEAYAFLKDTAAYEASGVVVKVPDWWRKRRTSRPEVKVTLGKKAPSAVGRDALLDFRVALSLDGEPISPAEWREILAGADGLRLIKGRWVEVDRERLKEVLEHWKRVERDASKDGLTFLEGMRMLAGVGTGAIEGPAGAEEAAWSEVTAGPWLAEVLADLQHPEGSRKADPGEALRGTLRPYQRDGVAWLWLLSRLGLGACLADDMGLGKTLQVLALLLLLRQNDIKGPNLLVVPASLLGNWRAEAERFAPSLRLHFAHASFAREGRAGAPGDLADLDLVVTTYCALQRTPWIAETSWGLVALDEAQAIKNPVAKQTRAAKALKSRTRLALTGTPVENRLGDLWSLFDFLCPGLLGTPKAFRASTRSMESARGSGYAPLRKLVRPYILRRLKSDRRVVADLPDKTEVRAYCGLTKAQAVLYGEAVEELRGKLDDVDGIQRRGVILAFLLRFKQICNHPSQWLGDGTYDPAASGKLLRLRELCEPIAARQEKVLVFTQFREMTAPLASFLTEVFGRPGLVLHGQVPVKARAALVADFQRDEGPPFFVLSLKAGGTGLNLTAASHVLHFDRWWNPAVEDQATDRAYRIGQKRNVLVHKFVCRGTVEEKIDALIESKKSLSDELLAGGGEAWLTEMKSDELLRLVSLDLHSALASE
jgi:hypothetical protein